MPPQFSVPGTSTEKPKGGKPKITGNIQLVPPGKQQEKQPTSNRAAPKDAEQTTDGWVKVEGRKKKRKDQRKAVSNPQTSGAPVEPNSDRKTGTGAKPAPRRRAPRTAAVAIKGTKEGTQQPSKS
ncbi:transient receptor potential cation channel subfamily v member 6 [Lasius niger]|uniref:Transient receptor potential cation channel subfamily v member 6 n=1 Tax=Lasius niger TaxID=67767 RepID=A0A0J7K7Z9_LASNI|nr:transient receptor potential cation channel subfamily v member 6 [Lasius niger]